jgi:hypothetical protein
MLKDKIERKTKKDQYQPMLTFETSSHDHETRT